MKKALAWAALLCLCLPPTIVEAAPTETRPASATVEFTPAAYGEIVVEAGIESPDKHTGVLRLLIDTGTATTFITPQAAEALGLTVNAPSGSGMPGVGSSAEIAGMSIGSLHGGPFSIPIVDDPLLAKLSSASNPIDGILGLDILSRYALLIDFQADRLTFVARSTPSADLLAQAGMDGASPIPMIETAAGFVCPCRMTIDGSTAEEPLLVDTGSVYCFLGSDQARNFPVPKKATSRIALLGSKPLSTAMTQGRLESIGDWQAGVPVEMAVQISGPSLAAGSTLGLSALRRFRVLLDFAHGALYLQPAPPQQLADR